MKSIKIRNLKTAIRVTKSFRCQTLYTSLIYSSLLRENTYHYERRSTLCRSKTIRPGISFISVAQLKALRELMSAIFNHYSFKPCPDSHACPVTKEAMAGRQLQMIMRKLPFPSLTPDLQNLSTPGQYSSETEPFLPENV